MAILKVKKNNLLFFALLSNHFSSGHAYYGEYPLAFAAAFGHIEIYDFLIEHGADPNMQDSYGNTVLHMLVIRNQIVSLKILDKTMIFIDKF